MTTLDTPHLDSVASHSHSHSPALGGSHSPYPPFHSLDVPLDDNVDLPTLEDGTSGGGTPLHTLDSSTPLHPTSHTPSHEPSSHSLDGLGGPMEDDVPLFSPALPPAHAHAHPHPHPHDGLSHPLPTPTLKSEHHTDIPLAPDISIPIHPHLMHHITPKHEDEEEEESDVESDEESEEDDESEDSEDEDPNRRRRRRDTDVDHEDEHPIKKQRTNSSTLAPPSHANLTSPMTLPSSPRHKSSFDELSSSQPDLLTASPALRPIDHEYNLFVSQDTDDEHFLPLSPNINGHSQQHDVILPSPSQKQNITKFLFGQPQSYQIQTQPKISHHGALGHPHTSHEDPNMEEYGTMISDVYGWKMTEHASALEVDEPVELIRWQDHPHDPYAIRVENVMNEFCGVLGKDDASALAPLLDRRWIKLTGSTLVKDDNQFRVRVHVMGHPIHLMESEKWIRKWPSRYISRQNPNFGVSTSTGVSELDQPQVGVMDGMQLREIESDLEKLFDGGSDFNKMPLAPKPPAIITHLYPYQRQGLQWMLLQESQRTMVSDDDKSFLFWEKQIDETTNTITYYNKLLKQTQNDPPERNRGGILADEMGLGKTLQIICLIAATSHDCLIQQQHSSWLSSFRIDDDADGDHDHDSSNFQLKNYVSRVTEKKQNPTLIVCPLSVITNWQQQCAKHTREGYFNVITYHGQHRARIADQLDQYDVVITTYNILASEFNGQDADGDGEDMPKPKPKKKRRDSSDDDSPRPKKRRSNKQSPLFLIHWFRVVLDEAHIIRDRTTRQSRAAVALKAERRWAVTGTPFQNRIGDAFALLAFLRVEPFTNYHLWSKLVINPLKNRDPKGLERLQMTMSSICLRRKKNEEIDGKPILSLPARHSHVIKVELSPHEQSLYDILAISGKAQFRAMLSDDQVLSNYAYVLEILLRMRQACDHISLIPETYHMGFERTHVDEMKRLLTLLDESLTDDCALCHRVVEDPVITPCAHFYCKKCFEDSVPKLNPPTCPSCGIEIALNKVVSMDMAKKIVHADQAALDRAATKAAEGNDSAKLKRLIQELRRQKQEDPTSKAIVFSQWTSFLNIVQAALFRKGITYVRLDGDMSSQNRAKALEAFEHNPSIRVFLISLKAGGVGLNLTTANKVFLMDPWWNPATEDQAVDRVHRLGQTKPVEVIRFIAANTLEEKILELQNTKRQMISTALSRYQKSRKEQQEERLNDLAILFK